MAAAAFRFGRRVEDAGNRYNRGWVMSVWLIYIDIKNHNFIDTKTKKRKLSEPLPLKTAPPAKKMAVAPPAPSRPAVMKKEPKPVVTSVKDAKSDSSFFSAPKPKPKLPTFKKAPPPAVKKESAANIAQPSSIDPFQEALKSMAKARRESPAQSTPPPIATSKSPPSTSGYTRSGKKKKTVSWAPEDQLESIRFIEKAVYDDDPAEVSISVPSII